MEDRDTTISDQPDTTTETPLESWKEIASYLQRDVRTAVRWEKREGLPVHRHLHESRASVYAYRSELDTWRANRVPPGEVRPAALFWPRALRVASGSALLVLLLFSTGNGGRAHSSAAATSAADGSGIVTREIWTDAMDGIFGSPSPDGLHLSFLDWMSLNLGIWDIENESQRLITSDGSWEEPRQMSYYSTWSSDGRYLAYHWAIIREGIQENELRVTGFEDSTPRVLLQDALYDWLQPLDWSPSGEHILVALNKNFGESRLTLLSFGNGTPDVLKTGDYPFQIGSFSPDGRYVAYSAPASLESANEDLFLFSLDSRTDNCFVEHPANDSLLGWVPDSEWVLFASDRTGSRGLWAIRLVDGSPQEEPVLLKRDFARTHPLGFSQDGSFYYSEVKVARDIFTLEVDIDRAAVVSPPEKAVLTHEGSNLYPFYSPDGKYLAYVSKRAGMFFPTLVGNTLCVKSLENGRERIFHNEFRKYRIEHLAAPRWYPHSEAIMFAGSGESMALYEINIKTGAIRLILDLEEDRLGGHTLSPDGEILFYVRRSGNQRRIIRRRLSSGDESELYRISGNDALSISLSPNGRWLAFSNRSRDKTLQVMSSTGGEARLLYRFPNEGSSASHAWSPDSKYIFFSRRDESNEGSLCQISVEDGVVRELVSGIQGLGCISVHPDGRQIAFHAATEIDSATDVWVMNDYLPN